ncbi:hypothetical protein LNQ82_03150 [Conchiformibius steedae DSM 2580]|uniref:Uncharacterized protein n=1 Tax=Conchiformibius steedae DSM 2580 TaxID=1121352 RepID=A0AAE9HU04_9NEIS|nr:hypothetical protein [Conchiformibius steedae]QMT33516.1 hypothetical protein H3L98_10675 [Conchiformibius steedae]URD68174.1 hypothetical protein LNQ82_03150 [Conchiformibius steedae DSM 2580]
MKVKTQSFDFFIKLSLFMLCKWLAGLVGIDLTFELDASTVIVLIPIKWSRLNNLILLVIDCFIKNRNKE